MFLLYDFVFLVYALIYLPYLLLTNRGYAGYSIRFGLFPSMIQKQIKAKPNIWIHAVSVGEVMVIDAFIDQLIAKYPDFQLIVTATTKTGYELAQKRLNDKAIVLPSPIDLSFVAREFVSLIEPRLYIAVETEIWPNLYRQLSRHEIPLAVINGRISDKSFGRYKMIRFLLKGVLNQVQVWCMQSQRDADRILELGANASKVVVTGNIKFDEFSPPLNPLINHLKLFHHELWWVAGSTHPGEEEIVLNVYGKIANDHPEWRLMIAPRHIERVPQIIELIGQRGFKAIKFSTLVSDGSKDDLKNTVIIVDTIGELRFLYSIASLVFVGKSLCVGGGHNVIEPAFYGKAIIIGPSVENFRDIVSCFKVGNAIVQVNDAQTFEGSVKDLCADDKKRQDLGKRALDVIALNQGAAKRSLELLAGLIK